MSSILSKLINLNGNVTGVLPVANGGTGVTSSTGSTNVVLSNSPTIVTPTIAQINNTAGVAIQGANTNSTASAGFVGEYMEANTASAGLSLTSAINNEIGSITLTAGCWDIQSIISYSPASSTNVTRLETFIGTASGDNITGKDVTRNSAVWAQSGGVVLGTIGMTLISPIFRVNLSGSTTYYGKTIAIFTVSTMTCGGTIRATRIR